MSNHPKYKMRLSLNVLNHLGINLYSNIPSVLSEVIANAWDADATQVNIDIQTNTETPRIIITDNGSGMSLNDINSKFLFVGYNRREQGDSTPGGRKPMGRKGIGKLSLFSIAGNIDVHSVKNSAQESFRLNAQKIQSAIKNKPSEEDPEVPVESIAFDRDFDAPHGTHIILSDLKRKIITTTIRALKKRIARRFSASCLDYMRVCINDDPITLADRDYFPNLEYVFSYGEDGVPREKCKKLSENGWHERPASFDEEGNSPENGKHTVRGWIGMSAKSGDLGRDSSDDNLNKISILMRNKVAVEDVLESFDFSSMFTRYIIGEIQADFLDDGKDIATSSRQKIIEDNPKYQALREFLKQELTNARNVRDNDKRQRGEKTAIDLFPKITEWLDKMSLDTRKKARDLLGRINGMNTDDRNKKAMFKFGIQAFESRRLHDKLDSLDAISAENLEGFLEVASELDNLEASYYYQITKERLHVIKKFTEMEREDVKEKILQEYIFEHLWLLDPSWERVKGSALMEARATRAFENVDKRLSSEEKRAMGRVDIQYRTTAGAHVIVELKRASVSVHKSALEDQVKKYQVALEEHLRQTNEVRSLTVNAVCVVGKPLVGWDNPETERKDRESLKSWNIRVMTYRTLIDHAEEAYQDYLDKAKEHEKFISMLSDLDDESEEDE